MHNDGPLVHPDDYRKFNTLLRFSREYDSSGSFNLTNRQSSAIAYYSSLPTRWGLADGAIHFHPIEPRAFRLSPLENF